jgi:hypothetical protein
MPVRKLCPANLERSTTPVFWSFSSVFVVPRKKYRSTPYYRSLMCLAILAAVYG